MRACRVRGEWPCARRDPASVENRCGHVRTESGPSARSTKDAPFGRGEAAARGFSQGFRSRSATSNCGSRSSILAARWASRSTDLRRGGEDAVARRKEDRGHQTTKPAERGAIPLPRRGRGWRRQRGAGCRFPRAGLPLRGGAAPVATARRPADARREWRPTPSSEKGPA